MKKNKTNIPEQFNDVLGSIYSNVEEGGGVTDLDNHDDFIELSVENDDDNNSPVLNTEDDDNANVDNAAHDDDSQIPQSVQNQMNNQDTQNDQTIDNEPTDADVIEAEQVGLLFDAIGQSFGWNIDEIDEKERPLTVEGLTKYLTDVVNQNSVPQYADERVQMLDEFVKNGGNFEDFYTAQQQLISFDNIDLEDESNQKLAIKELMKHDGYTDEQINKRISRYEDADMLYDESQDAVERLKIIRKQELEDQAKQQKELAEQQAEQQKKFFEDVTNGINSLTNIRGIAIPKEDRKALYEYIFKVDKDGYTQYLKDYQANLSKNLIESAYFTMKADALINGALKQGETSAAEKLRKMLRHSSRNHSVYNADKEKQKSVVDLTTGLF